MRGDRRVVSAGCAALALALLGCGSITPLDGADGGVTAPPKVTVSDAGILSAATDDSGAPGGGSKDPTSPPASKDASPPPPKMKDAGSPTAGTSGAPGPGGGATSPQGCATKGDCSEGRVCHVATGLCVECLLDGDCKEKTKLCDLASLTCLCPSDANCGGG